MHGEGDAPATRLRSKDLLGIAELSPEEILLILDTAVAMKEVGTRPIKKVPALRGKTVINLFFEPSTRTRTSFEIAEKRLSADTLNIAASTSSVVKGETLADTAMNLEAMAPDLLVVRHSASGACHFKDATHVARARKREELETHPSRQVRENILRQSSRAASTWRHIFVVAKDPAPPANQTSYICNPLRGCHIAMTISRHTGSRHPCSSPAGSGRASVRHTFGFRLWPGRLHQ